MYKGRSGRIFGPLKKYIDHMPKDHKDIFVKKLSRLTDKLKLTLLDELNLDDACNLYGKIQVKTILLDEVVKDLTFFEGNMISIWPNELYDIREVTEKQSDTCLKLIRVLLSKT